MHGMDGKDGMDVMVGMDSMDGMYRMDRMADLDGNDVSTRIFVNLELKFDPYLPKYSPILKFDNPGKESKRSGKQDATSS